MTTVQGNAAVIGLDVSLTGTGVASSSGWCTRVGKAGVLKAPLPERVKIIDGFLGDIMELVGLRPDLVVIEGASLHSKGMGTVERHGLWWLLVRTCQHRNLPLAVAAPTGRMLYATGKGMATKEVVVDAVARRWPQYPTKGDNNLCDAVVLAAMGADHLGRALCVMPAANRKALDKVSWPEGLGS
jgi:Holliday junction resolvasome RuvABC endonuclease subunit